MEGQVIQFTKKLYEVEEYMTIPFDINMRAKIIKEDAQDNDKDIINVTVDMTDYLEHNQELMRNNWEDDHGHVRLNWSQTKYWPKDNILKIVIFRIIKPYKIVK